MPNKPLPEVPEALVPFVESLARLLAESFLREIEGRKPARHTGDS